MDNTRKNVYSERVFFFSDAVFAIAITLLALEIRLPAGLDVNSNAAVWHAVTALGPHYLAFFVSFLIIGRLWAGHVRKYAGGVRNDRTFVSLNLFMLMVVAFLPFPTTLFSVSPTRVATILYSLVMVAVGLFSALAWWHAAIAHDYVEPVPSKRDAWAELMSPLLICFVFGLAALIALASPDVARWTWILLVPAIRWVRW